MQHSKSTYIYILIRFRIIISHIYMEIISNYRDPITINIVIDYGKQCLFKSNAREPVGLQTPITDTTYNKQFQPNTAVCNSGARVDGTIHQNSKSSTTLTFSHSVVCLVDGYIYTNHLKLLTKFPYRLPHDIWCAENQETPGIHQYFYQQIQL